MVPTAWPRGVSSTVATLSFGTTLAESKSPIWRALISLSWVTDTRMLSVCDARIVSDGRITQQSMVETYLEVAMKHRLSMQERQSRRDLLRIPTHLETREALARRCELLHVRAQRA